MFISFKPFQWYMMYKKQKIFTNIQMQGQVRKSIEKFKSINVYYYMYDTNVFAWNWGSRVSARLNNEIFSTCS